MREKELLEEEDRLGRGGRELRRRICFRVMEEEEERGWGWCWKEGEGGGRKVVS